MSDTATATPKATTSGEELLLSVLYRLTEGATIFTQEAERSLHLGAIESLARAAGADVTHIGSSLRSKVRGFITEKGLAVLPPEAEAAPAPAAITAGEVGSMIAANNATLLSQIGALINPAPAAPPAAATEPAPAPTAPAEAAAPTS